MLDKEISLREQEFVRGTILSLCKWLKSSKHDARMLEILIDLLHRLEGEDQLAILWLVERSELKNLKARNTDFSTWGQEYGLTPEERFV